MSEDIKRGIFKIMIIIIPLLFGHQLYAADQAILGTALTNVIRDLDIPLVLGGTITSTLGFGIIIGSLTASLIIRKRGFVYTLSLAITVFSFFTFLTGFSFSAWDLLLFRILVGVGEGLWNVAYYSMVGILFSKNRGLAIAITGNMYPIGLLWAYPLITSFITWFGNWRLPFIFFGLLGFPIAVLINLFIKSIMLKQYTHSGNGAKKDRRLHSYRSTLMKASVLSGCIMMFFHALIHSSILTYYPTYLVNIGYDQTVSGVLMAILSFMLLISTVIILLLSDRYGRKPFIYCSALFSAVASVLMFQLRSKNFVYSAAICVFFGATQMGGGYPLIAAFVQDSVSVETIGFAMSVISISYYVGNLIAGPATGYIVFFSGWMFGGFWLALCCLSVFTALILVKARI
ncbi:MAG: MFS transporter [Candidatus Jordarchaeaceae archaeon]